MRVDVALTSASLDRQQPSVCVVVDVLRATSTAVAMFGSGLTELLVAETVEAARALARAHPGYLLCGERKSLPPPGFDYGNSPAEFGTVSLDNRRAILTTTNGTRALSKVVQHPVVLLGAMLNETAVASTAAREALDRGLDVLLLCAGTNDGRDVAVEDTFCAGAIVERLAELAGGSLIEGSGALTAREVNRSYRGSAIEALRQSPHGAHLADLGFARDVEFCAQRDRFDFVPHVAAGSGGELAVRVAREAG